MFTLNDMRILLRTKPFVPFRLWYSEGGCFDVRRPDHALPFRQYVIVGLYDPNALDEPFDRHVVLRYTHVTSVEVLTPDDMPTPMTAS
ncbi:MAG TPA: hypothetical protein VMF69_05680 [Gemmataceae bacterium]|nr:hypothetical protein [Gemmataceae bacterium]